MLWCSSRLMSNRDAKKCLHQPSLDSASPDSVWHSLTIIYTMGELAIRQGKETVEEFPARLRMSIDDCPRDKRLTSKTASPSHYASIQKSTSPMLIHSRNQQHQMTSRSTHESFFQLLNLWSFIKVWDWRKNWWKPPLLLLLWILVIIIEIIRILAACFRIAFYYVLRIAPRIREYVHYKLHPTFRYPIAKQGYGPQRLGRRPRALTLEFPSDEEVKESVHLKAKESCKGADQTARRQTDRLGQKHGPADDPKQQTEQRTFLQHQSILFCKIPPEIRLLIYRALVLPPEGAELRIDRTYGPLCSYSHVYGEGSGSTPQGHGNCKPNRSAGLLCSCRQVYAHFPPSHPCISIAIDEIQLHGSHKNPLPRNLVQHPPLHHPPRSARDDCSPAVSVYSLPAFR